MSGAPVRLAGQVALGAVLVALGATAGYLWRGDPTTSTDATTAGRAADSASGDAAEPPHPASGADAPAGHDHAAMLAAQAAAGTAADPMAGHDHAAMMAAASAPAVSLTAEQLARGGIRTVPARAGQITTALRLPGLVEPNAYKSLAVTSLVPGRITQVQAELGQAVNVQDPLVTIYSPELADAQTAFIAARAQQVAHGQRQTRLQRLTAIGAATREELETIEAERAMHDSNVEIARARLALLGIPEERTQRLAGPQDVVTTTTLRAPMAGVVTQRQANIGLNIDPGMVLFTIVDLSTVWVQAELFERDFARVRVGSPATVTSVAYPDLALRGRVSYIDPQVQAASRSAKLRVEVPNPGARLRLGMYVDATVGDPAERAGVLVPKAALQVVGDSTVVYVADAAQPGRFQERTVMVADTRGDDAIVTSGLAAGDAVVTDGVFFVRAERERTRARQP